MPEPGQRDAGSEFSHSVFSTIKQIEDVANVVVPLHCTDEMVVNVIEWIMGGGIIVSESRSR